LVKRRHPSCEPLAFSCTVFGLARGQDTVSNFEVIFEL
jgi:hypothetical protein